MRASGAALAGVLLAAVPVVANPLGGQVVGGQATIATTTPGTLTVEQQSQRAAINWQSFNIAPTETTRFVQPSSSAIALNRVKAGDPSVIAGKLDANGQLVLVNPSGVIFTKGAQVNVNSLIATPTDIKTSDFMAGRMNFSVPSTDPRARIVNDGHITVTQKGLAALVGPGVANNGVIAARLGTVVLGGAKTYTLDFYGDGLIKFDIGSAVDSVPLGRDGKPLASLVSNAGQIEAAGGTVLLTANAAAGILSNVIDAGGTISARSYAQTPGSVTIDAGAGNAARLTGTIDVSGLGAGQVGGQAVVTGGSVALTQTARIDARGAVGGGRVAIGGGPHGGDPLVRNALSTNISAGAQIDASATDNGKGGTVSVWSDGTTNFDGTILAKGGANGGDGGWVETSGHVLSVGDTASVVTSAPYGTVGSWLLDPWNTTISASATSGETCSGTPLTCTATDSGANINAVALDIALFFTDVTITTGSNGSESGNITVNAPVSWITGTKLTLNAAGNIVINADISASSANSVLALDAGGTITQPGGAITAATLTGSAQTATLSSSLNAIATLGDFTTTAGDLQLTTGSSLTVSGKVVAAGKLSLETQGAGNDITLNGNLSAGSGPVSLISAGGITGAGAIDAGSLLIQSVGAVSLSGDNTVGKLAADITGAGSSLLFNNTGTALAVDTVGGVAGIATSDGDVALSTTASGDITLAASIDAGAGTVALNSAGAIAQTGGVVTGDTLFLSASTGIGSASSPLQTQVGTLGADTASGGIFIGNGVTTPITLTIGGSDGVQVTGAAGDIQLVNQGTIDVTTDGDTIRGPGNVTVMAQGNKADIQTGGTSETPIRGLASGVVDVEAGHDIVLGEVGGFEASSIRSVSGSIILNAGRDITVNKGAVVNVIGGSGGITATAGGDITMTTGSGSIAGQPEFFTAGGPIALTTGAGGMLTLDSSGSDAVFSNGGDITLTADALKIGKGIDAGGGTVTIGPATAGLAIDVGASTGAGHLMLDAAALSAEVTADTLIIGSPTAGAITINGGLSPVNVTNLTLASGATIGESGGGLIGTAGTLTTNSVGGTTLNGANSVATFNAANTTSGEISLTNTAPTLTLTGISQSGGGAITIANTGGLSLTGAVSAGGGAVDLTASGAIGESGGGLISTTGTLSGSAASVTLGAAGNRVAALGEFTTTSGDFTLVNGAALAVTGGVASAGNLTLETTGGSFDIALSGSLTASTGTVTLNSSGGISGTGAIDPGSLLIVSVGSVSLTGANTVDNLAASITGAGSSLTFNNTANALAVDTVGGVNGITTNNGAVTLSTTTSGSLTLNQPIAAGAGTVTLASAGGITQNAGAIITADTLTGGAVGDASLDETNIVKTFGPFATGGSLSFTDGRSFSTGGTIGSSADLSLTTTGTGSDMTLADDLLAVSGTVTLTSAGKIGQTGGAIIADMVTGSTVGGADFSATNFVDNFGPFSDSAGGAITLVNGQDLTVNGAVSTGGDVSLLLTGNEGPADLTIASAVSAGAGKTLTLFATGSITETAGGSLTGTNLVAVTEDQFGNGDISLDQADANAVSGHVTLASLNGGEAPGTALGGGDIRFTDTAGFTIAPATIAVPKGATLALENGIATTGTVAAGTAGDLTIAAGAGVTGSSVTLGTLGNFTNNAGAGAITASDQWLVYSTDPNLDNDGGLTPDFYQYGASFGVNALSGTAPAVAGSNGFLYSLAPVIRLTGVTKVYDSTTALPGSAAAFTTTGANTGDTVTIDVSSVGGAYAEPNAGSGIKVTLTTLPTIAASRGGIPVFGYGFGTVKDDPIGTITPAMLTITATDQSKTYGQTASLGTTSFTSSGLLGSDNVSGVTLASSGSAATAGVAGSPYAITAGDAVGTGLGNYTISYVAGKLTVDPAALTITATDQSKTYGQTASLGTTSFTTAGLVNGDTVSGVTLASTGAVATAGVAGSPYAIAASNAVGSGLGNYTISYVAGKLTVDPAALTITATDQSKTYGQTASLGTTAFTTAGLVNGDTVSGVTLTSGGVVATAGVVGSPYAITASNAVGAGLGNYTISYLAGKLTVDPAALTITATDQSKIYGQTASLGTTAFTTAGLVNGDSVSGVTLASSGAAATAGVTGSPYAITASNAVGTGLGNYTISYVAGKLTVDPAALTITATDQSKTYGQTASLGTTSFTTAGLVNGDVVSGVTLASSGTVATAGVAGSPYAITASNEVGTGLGNYTISYVAGKLTVHPAALTITATDQSKTYGQTAALGTTAFTTAGLVNGDSVSGVTLASSGAVATAGVAGSPYAITASNAVGSGLGNYTISYVAGKLTVDPAALTITATDRSKTYGQTALLGTTAFTTAGLVNGDTVSGVTLASTGAVATAGVAGSPYAITAGNAVGSGLANYTISYVAGKLTIDPAVLTAALTGTIGKDYDGTTSAKRLTSTNYTLTGVVNGDDVSLNNPSAGTYATANAGSGIGVSVTGLALSGSAAANYVLASTAVSGDIGTISPAELTAGLTGIVTKQYDGTTVATLSPDNYTLSGLIGGDSVVLKAPATGVYASPNAGTGIPVTVTGLGLSGAAAGNYVLVGTTATADIGEIVSLPLTETQAIQAVLQPQPATQSKPDTFYLPFGGNIACIASSGAQKGTHMPLLSGFGVTDTAGSGLLLDQPYAAAEMQNGVLMPITVSSCEALAGFQSLLQGLGR